VDTKEFFLNIEYEGYQIKAQDTETWRENQKYRQLCHLVSSSGKLFGYVQT